MYWKGLNIYQYSCVLGQNGDISTFSPVEFLDVDMTDKVIISVTIPALDPQTERFQAFKVMPRAAVCISIYM